ncbi:hypothetical protein B296_00041141 [Ensete ventricosum]|uniref:Uncharacterized protein n=1 Tax=Ensete ventricosum TaxID=4639 RepID=A0A426Z2M5_ENSVE|nr:hypothetical protein B296_00041141 [Ensete ventricosum]
MAKLASREWILEVKTQKISKVFEEKLSGKVPPVVDYSGGIYTCRAEGGRTEEFNGHDAFDRPVDTTLHGSLLLLVPGVSFVGATNYQYNPLSILHCVNATCTCRDGCRHRLRVPGSRRGPRADVFRLTCSANMVLRLIWRRASCLELAERCLELSALLARKVLSCMLCQTIASVALVLNRHPQTLCLLSIDDLEARLRFPLHPMIEACLDRWQISLM